jgi:beta-lactamase class A
MKTLALEKYGFLIAGLVFFSCQPASWRATRQEIRASFLSRSGYFALAFKDLSTGYAWTIHGKKVFHAASTMKTPVLIEVYKQTSEGKFSLNDSIAIINQFRSIVNGRPYQLNRSDDGDTTLYDYIGRKRPVDDLVFRMITRSGNLATNILIDRVGATNVTNTMRTLGANRLTVLRGVEDSLAYAKGLSNVTTAEDLMIIYEKLAKGEIVSRPASDSMIVILMHQEFNETIPAKLPPGTRVAHKTGNFTGVRHDSGIVFLPDGRKYVLVILSRDLVNEKEAIDMMATVSRKIYDRMVK